MSEESTASWFEEWFDSSYYHILYSNRNEEEADRFIRRLTQIDLFPKKGSVLDLGCGKGRHAQVFHDLGYRTTGIDLAPNSIETAQRLRSGEIHFMVGDMRDFHLDQPADVIANLFTSFGYFEDVKDNAKVLDCVSRNLKENGLFILDFFNLQHVADHLVEAETKMIKKVRFDITRRISNSHVLKTIHVSDPEEVIQDEAALTVTEQVQALSVNKLKELLMNAGFEIQATFGDYNLEQFDLQTSPRIILLATKV